MYDVMLDFPILFPKETTLAEMVWLEGTNFQLGDYIGNYFEESGVEGCMFWPIEPPNRKHFRGLKTTYAEAMKKWELDDMLNKYYVPTKNKEIRSFNSWTQLGEGAFAKQMTFEECADIEGKVWRPLGDGKFKQIGIQLPDGNQQPNESNTYCGEASFEHYLNRIKSVPLVNRFKDDDLKSMNIYVGETVTDLLDNFTLDIPREQFVFPYPHGVSFVRKDFTTYLYQENDTIMWNYFGNDGKFRMNNLDFDEIIHDGRISQKSISKFYKSEVKSLTNDVEGFMDIYFERQFGVKTDEIPNNHLSLGIIRCLFECVYGIAPNFVKNNEEPGLRVEHDHAEYPKIDDCWSIITEDLLKIICLNDRDFAKEKLKTNKDGGKNAISSKTSPKRVGRRYFKWGEDDVQYVYPKSGKSGAKVRRHIRRGHTKKQPIKYPENYEGKAFQMGGAWYVSKTIAPYWAGGKLSIPENQLSPFCFGAIKMKYAGGSRIASQWIREIEKELGRKLLHNENGGKEYRVPYNDSKWFFLDAWDEETNTAYEFHGDYYHGNPNIFNSEDLNEKVNKTYGELYEATLQKKAILEDLGYNYIYIWEAEFQNR